MSANAKNLFGFQLTCYCCPATVERRERRGTNGIKCQDLEMVISFHDKRVLSFSEE